MTRPKSKVKISNFSRQNLHSLYFKRCQIEMAHMSRESLIDTETVFRRRDKVRI